MKRQLSNTIYGLKFATEKNDFERLKPSSGKKRNVFIANPIGEGKYCQLNIFFVKTVPIAFIFVAAKLNDAWKKSH